MNCLHPEFKSMVRVTKTDHGRFLATIKIKCVACNEMFKFFGAAPGQNLNGIGTSSDGVELRAAIGTPETLLNYYEQATGIKISESALQEAMEKDMDVSQAPVEPFIKMEPIK